MPSVIVAIGSIVISTVGAAVSTSLGLALASAGAMAVGAATVIGGLMLANKAISSLYEMPKVDTDASRQRTVKGTIEPQKILYGENLVSGPISFVGTYGDTNRVLAHAVVLASHEVEEITDIYFDEEIVTDSQIDVNGYVTSGKFGPVGNKTFNFNGTNFGTNICKINRYTGASGQTADADLVANFFSYTSNHIGTGLAYITTHWLLKDGSQKTWDQYAPRDIKAIVKGRKVYDPRTDTTSYSDNPALCLADYLTNTDFGMGIASAKIDWDSVSDAADACDVTVSVPSATEKRFTCNGVLFGTDTHKTNINKILSSMNGLMSFTNGKFVIRAGVYEAPAVSLNEDHLAGAVSVKTSFERSDRFNTVTGTFIDPAQNYKATEFPEVQITAALLRDNNEVLTKDIQLPMTNSSYMAQRIAHKLVQISDQQKVVTFPTNLAGMQIAIGDRVSVSLEEFSWTDKVFICLGWTFSDSGNGGVSLILREDDAGSYADPLVGEYSTISATGGIITGFRGYPDPQNLSATAGLKSIELNWDNPDNMKDIEEIEVFASPNSSWASAVKIGAVKGTQFKHDESNTVDSVAVGDQRWYWVRARGYSFGDTDDAVSDRNPDNNTSSITATVGVIPWADVDGDDKPEDNATVGATIGTDLKDSGAAVVGDNDVLNRNAIVTVTTDDNAAPDNTEFSAETGRNPKTGDTAITTDTTGSTDVTYAWKYNGTSWDSIPNLISGDLIVDGSVTADNIAAGAITTSKLSVGDLSVLNQNAGFEEGDISWSGDPEFSIVASNARTGTYAAKFTSSSGSARLYSETQITATDGETFYIEGYIKHGGGTAYGGRISITAYNSSGSSIGGASSPIVTNQTTYTKVSVSHSAPAGTAYVVASLYGIGDATTIYYYDDVRLFRTANSVLIADGAVVADKISAGTITFDKLIGDVVKNTELSLPSSTAFTANGSTTITTLTLPAPDDTTVGHLPVAIVNIEWYVQAGSDWDDDGGDFPEVNFELRQGTTLVGNSTYTHDKFNDTTANFERHSVAIMAEGTVTTSSQSFSLIVRTTSFNTGGGTTKGYVDKVSGVILGIR